MGFPVDVVDDTIKTAVMGSYCRHDIYISPTEQGHTMILFPKLDAPKAGWGENVHKLVTSVNEGSELLNVNVEAQTQKVYLSVTMREGVDMQDFNYVLACIIEAGDNIVVPVYQANAFDNLKERE